MNLILLFDNDFIDESIVQLKGRRFFHISKILKLSTNDTVTIGKKDGLIGKGLIKNINDDHVTITVNLALPPPPPLPLTLIIALPRPKMLKRILQTCATMGVKKIIFINSFRVEKSYWQTPLLNREPIQEQLVLGLEQGKDTVMPTVILENRFKPFVEDTLPSIIKDTTALVAHPNSHSPCPISLNQPTTLVIGPEGGFIPYEIEKLNAAGCQSIHLGERILKVETAIPVLLGKLFS